MRHSQSAPSDRSRQQDLHARRADHGVAAAKVDVEGVGYAAHGRRGLQEGHLRGAAATRRG